MVRDCPISKTQRMEINHAQASALNSDGPKKNCLHALKFRGDQEDSLDVDASTLQVFPINV